MRTTIRYVILTAFRDRLFMGLVVGLVLAAILSSFMGGMALLEHEQMTISFTAAACRFILVTGLVVFTCFHLRQAFDNREIDVLLSRPISRVNLVISYWLGFAVVSTLLCAVAILVVYVIGALNMAGFIAWAVSITLEMWLVVALTLFMGLTLKSAVSSVLASLGFYLLARMTGFFIATVQHSTLFVDREINKTFKIITDVLATFVPRLDFFAKSTWLVYGEVTQQDWILFMVQPAIYVPLLLAAAMIDFKRRQF